MTTMAHTWKPSPAQIELLRTIFVERVPTSEPNREQFWTNLTQNVSNRATFENAIKVLKARPRVQVQPVRPSAPPAPVPPTNLPEFAKEDGLYRDPSDGTLYRLSTPAKRNSWDQPSTTVSVYSKKATVRRLTPEGRMVKKGKWTRLKAHESRALLALSYGEAKGYRPIGKKVLASWAMDEQERIQWAVGICLGTNAAGHVCYRGLEDAVSVYNQLGPVCATRAGIEREIPPTEFTYDPANFA